MITATEILKQVVAIPSVEPTQAGSGEEAGEERMARYFADFLSDCGFEVEWQWVQPGRPNVWAWGGSPDRRKVVLLESHLDTVGTDGMVVPPFAAEIRDGRLHGRGAADCKGGLASALAACARTDLAALAARGVTLLYLGTMGEETGNNGAWAAAPRLPEGLWRTVVLEPTEMTAVFASKGIAAIEVDIAGRSAHGSAPEEGVNAIYAAAEFTRRLRALADAEGIRFGNEWVGRPSMNVGMIRGGIAPNVVAPSCHVEFDWRVVAPERIGDVKAAIGALLDGMVAEDLCLSWTLKQTQNNEPLSTDPDSPLVGAFRDAFRAEGLPPATGGVRWCCDASVFCPRSAETVVFGPGSIKRAHASDEWIDLAEVEAAARVLQRVIAAF